MTSLVLNTDKRLFYLLSELMLCKASLLTFIARTNLYLKICQIADLKCRIFQHQEQLLYVPSVF